MDSFFFPAELILRNCGSGRSEEPSGGNVLRLIQIRLPALYTKTGPHFRLVEARPNIRVGPYLIGESPIQVPETQSASHPHAQRRVSAALNNALNFLGFFMLDRSLSLGLRNRTVGCLG